MCAYQEFPDSFAIGELGETFTHYIIQGAINSDRNVKRLGKFKSDIEMGWEQEMTQLRHKPSCLKPIQNPDTTAAYTAAPLPYFLKCHKEHSLLRMISSQHE